MSALLVFGVVFAGALDSKIFSFLISTDDNDDDDWVEVEMEEHSKDKSEPPLTSSEYSNMDDIESKTSYESPKEAVAAATTSDGLLA